MKQGFWKSVGWIALEEWRSLAHNRVALIASGIVLALAAAATLVGMDQHRTIESERARYQSTADQQWDAQPDRHPHRVVHYGHYVFRPLNALAFFDFGVDPYTGHSLYLEGHRQNTANFSDARQSSVLLQFGTLTPAFVLQTLVPLLIVFLAFGSIARERERGQLRLTLAHGVSGRQLLTGKLVCHAVMACLLASPAFVGLAAIALVEEGSRSQALLMILGYGCYLLIWVGTAVLVSAIVPRARDALMALVALWIVTVILLPRMLTDVASVRIQLPTRIETEVAIHKELAAIGDSHNPDDPYFRKFREQTLAKYGVNKVEDLPVNYGGLVMAEGERLTSELFDRTMQDDFHLQDAQNRFVNAFAIVSPVMALRSMSTVLAETDRESHQRFLVKAEKYRYNLIQALNRVHTEKVRYKNDRDQRVSNSHWRDLPRFHFPPSDFGKVLAGRILPAMGTIGMWLGMLALAMHLIGNRLERTGR